MAQMMNDPTISSEEKRCLDRFRRAVDDRVRLLGSAINPVRDLVLADLASCIGLDLSNVHKDGTLLCALWYVILEAIKKMIRLRDMKFPSLDSFLTAYGDRFSSEPESEKIVLWQTANWMSLLFLMITARKNKGLAMQVVPKVCEGWDAKYITGSGQTKATANRVHVFETEGSVKPSERGRARLKRESEEAKVPIQGAKRQRGYKEPAVKKTAKPKWAGSDFVFAETLLSVSQVPQVPSRGGGGGGGARRFQVAGMHQLEETQDVCTNDEKAYWERDRSDAAGSGLLSLLGASTDMGDILDMGDPTDPTDPTDPSNPNQRDSWTHLAGSRSRSKSPFDGLPSLSAFPSIDLTPLGRSNDGFLQHGAFSSGEMSNFFTG
ncbi:hypothetical protein B484DRAFT_454518 [Ochromonadaceae sp. CCMP2298]|nr:hypothetical protein B484DRAFT_454518 [Ochromonadaceae sp. CCMP2298]